MSIRTLRAPAGVALAALVLVAGCADRLTAPAPASCVLPATTVTAPMIAGISIAHLRNGVDDAATRVVPTLVGAAQAAKLQDALRRASASAGSSATADREAACVALHAALDALAALPDLPATAPDRDGIRLVIDVVTAFVKQ